MVNKQSTKKECKNGSDLKENREGLSLSECGDLLTTEEASKFLRISIDTMYKWIEKKIIPYYRISGKKVLFNKKKLSLWLESLETSESY